MSHHVDVMIVGGGLIGKCLAIMLSDLPIKIGIIESKQPLQSTDKNVEARMFALAYGTQKILAQMGCWSDLAKSAMPIKKVHISEKGRFGNALLQAQQMNVSQLGFVVSANELNALLEKRCSELKELTWFCPAELTALSYRDHQVEAQIQTKTGQQICSADLLIGADGTHSTVRRLLSIPTTFYDYQQMAMVTHVTVSHSHDHVAYERFTEKGTIALLPVKQKRMALIWTLPTIDAEHMKKAEDAYFIEKLQKEFGYRLGHFSELGTRVMYPLKRYHAQEVCRPGVVLVGNAADTLHPVAAQGFNLGIRGAACLVDDISSRLQKKQSIRSYQLLKDYVKARQTDQKQVKVLTHGLAVLFAKQWPILRSVRQLGIIAIDNLSPLRKRLMKRTMGLGE